VVVFDRQNWRSFRPHYARYLGGLLGFWTRILGWRRVDDRHSTHSSAVGTSTIAA